MKYKNHHSSICFSEQVLGNGEFDNICNLVYVDRFTFKREKTNEIAREIGQINKKIKNKPYVLIGPGRWGTADHWLGIPVNWEEITNNSARLSALIKAADTKLPDASVKIFILTIFRNWNNFISTIAQFFNKTVTNKTRCSSY